MNINPKTNKTIERFETPVLFLLFNRLSTTKKVFHSIKTIKPTRLYIAIDGARPDHKEEKEQVAAVCDYVMENIDWKCEVKTLIRNENLGCKNSVSKAISWFFSYEEMGIILEDDCLPSESFYFFCQQLLKRYENDLRVWSIGGYKFPYTQGDGNSYNFTRYTHIWGWATWADRWKAYDVNISEYQKNEKLLTDYDFFQSPKENKERVKVLNKVLSGDIDTWDYQWNFAVRTNNGLSIRPAVNLVRNIGFGEKATHTSGRNLDHEMNEEQNIEFPLIHPKILMAYSKGDHVLARRSFVSRLLSFIK